MVIRDDEWLRLTPLTENWKTVIDIRVWRKTPTGGMPTKKSIIIPFPLVTRLIAALQGVHEKVNVLESKKTGANA